MRRELKGRIIYRQQSGGFPRRRCQQSSGAPPRRQQSGGRPPQSEVPARGLAHLVALEDGQGTGGEAQTSIRAGEGAMAIATIILVFFNWQPL